MVGVEEGTEGFAMEEQLNIFAPGPKFISLLSANYYSHIVQKTLIVSVMQVLKYYQIRHVDQSEPICNVSCHGQPTTAAGDLIVLLTTKTDVFTYGIGFIT